MRKKSTDQSWGRGMRLRAAGYTTKARPDPEAATSSIPTPSCLAKKPNTLKMTKPINTEVEQLENAMTMASLERNKMVKVKNYFRNKRMTKERGA